ncbi:LPS-assembly protein LptD [Leptothrix ochracea]|uniref:LPS-assembly protein LptD n=1 Tax=Leptothrix ochracea TaxID=735331 RepID=UPI0034E2E759
MFPLLRSCSWTFIGLGWVGSLGLFGAAHAQTTAPDTRGPIQIEADSLSGRLNRDFIAEGKVLLQQNRLSLRADRLSYDLNSQQTRAEGQVELLSDGNVFRGTLLDFNASTLNGRLEAPHYHFGRTQASGQAEFIEFKGQDHVEAQGSTYSSCPAPKDKDNSTLPWVLTTQHLSLDFARNEGVAEGAVVRFYDVPILAMPLMSFPISTERKSGWLPPVLNLSNTSGVEFGVPYYWNIAPNHDATITPILSSRRGLELDGEFRYLEPSLGGTVSLVTLPYDTWAQTQRWAARWQHTGTLSRDWHYDWATLRVSDDNYWQDGLHGAENWTPRLLESRASLQRHDHWQWGGLHVDQQFYTKAQQWQILQSPLASATIVAPYRRDPQVGLRWQARSGALEAQLETEYNRFVHEDPTMLQGARAHGLGSVAWHFGDEGWQVSPKLLVNSAQYTLEQPLVTGDLSYFRTIPSFSLDNQWVFERPTQWGTQGLTQTLEPHVLYVRTPWYDQSMVPRFDSAALDLNAATIFADTAFSGIDRVADANRVTTGVRSRWLSDRTGAEVARVDIAQRMLLEPQRITEDGQPLTRQFSDVLLSGSISTDPHWRFEGSVQHDPEISRISRSVLSGQYSPGPFRTVSAIYRLQRGTSEQVALGWQWPISGAIPALSELWGDTPAPQRKSPSSGGGSDCQGTLYGVGRFDYSMRDERLTGLIGGLEYDAGCWIGRFVVQHQSTLPDTATTRLLFQLELVGLSRLGQNPLTVLKDNIPGYRLLRESGVNPGSPSAVPTPSPSSLPSPDLSHP